MRSLKRIFTLLSAVAFLGVAHEVSADKNPVKFPKDGGEARFGDIGFSRSDHATKVESDTLTAALSDTTTSFPIAGAKSAAVVWSVTDADNNSNVSGHTLTVTPQVSIDRSTWQNLTTTFSISGSSGATATVYSQNFVLHNAVADTSTLYNSTLDRLRSMNFLRFIIAKTDLAPEVDTVHVTGQYNVIY